MAETCGDNRFETIEAAKEKLLIATNIESNEAEMAVLDSFLFRAWQMGWLPEKKQTCTNLATRKDEFVCSECGCDVVGCIVDDFGNFDNPLWFSYCPNCDAQVVGD